jgi:phage terminase small subunit
MAELTDKQQRFCEEYLVDLNATQAAIRAGYSEDSAAAIGCENLIKPNIQAEIQRLQARVSKKLEISRERVLKEYARIAFADIRDMYDQNSRLIPPKDLSDDAAAALAGMEVFEEFGFDKSGERVHIGDTKKVKLWDKLKALDSLGKHIGLFEEDNKQKNPNMDFSKLTAEEKYQLLILMQKSSGNAGAAG